MSTEVGLLVLGELMAGREGLPDREAWPELPTWMDAGTEETGRPAWGPRGQRLCPGLRLSVARSEGTNVRSIVVLLMVVPVVGTLGSRLAMW